MDDIVIIGSSGHAKVVIDIVQQEGKYNIIGLLDRFRSAGEETLGYRVLGREESLAGLAKNHSLKGVLVAVGDNLDRSKVVKRVRRICPDLPFVSSVHPRAAIATDVSIGEGTVIMAGVSVNSSCSIGRFCILNTNSSLDHDSIMEDFSSLAPRATTGGYCRIGSYSAISIGAILNRGVHIGDNTVIGAASLVLEPIDSFMLAYGSPAKVIRKRKPGEKYF